MSFDAYTDPGAEALLRTARERFVVRLRLGRTVLTELTAAVAFLVVAGSLAVWAPSSRSLSVPALASVAIVFLAARQVRFAVGSAHTWPAQLAFVPMLFLLPLELVPAIVVALDLVGLLPRLLRRREPSPRAVCALIAARVADTWYTVGPVAVLLVYSSRPFAWSHFPVYLLAFAAQVLVDVGVGLARTWFAERILPSAQIQMLWMYLTDAALSLVGLQLFITAEHTPELVLLELPLIGLLGMFAKERRRRLDGTLALSGAYRGTAMLLGDVIEGDDEYTGAHSRAVVELSVSLADRLGLDATVRQRVEFGALLHDIGKIRVPKEILNKPGKLDDAEWEVMRRHTVYGEEMLAQVGGVLGGVGTVVRHSHERWDGAGYPDRIAGATIPIEARIVSACDAFNAMTTDRPYRPAMPLDAAVAEMLRCAGSQFDPAVVEGLLEELLATSESLAARPALIPDPAATEPARAPARLFAPAGVAQSVRAAES